MPVSSPPPRGRGSPPPSRSYGDPVVVGWCTDLVRGSGPEAVPREAALVLGGRHAAILAGRPHARPRLVVAGLGPARPPLRLGRPGAARHVLAALDDEAWRVREGALRVVARRRLDDDPQRVSDLRDDPVERVRSAAARALVRLEGGA